MTRPITSSHRARRRSALSLFISLSIFAVPAGAVAQESSEADASGGREASPLPQPSAVQEMVREWVKVQQTISEEKAAWQADKEQLVDLNEVRKREIAELDELIAAAGNRLTDAEKRRADLISDEQSLRDIRSLLDARIGDLENSLRALAPGFPPPLRNKIGEALDRLQNPKPDEPLQNRFRDVLTILTEADNFHRNLTVDTEIRQAPDGTGGEFEVDILYLGLSRAYYTDRSGKHAGTGVPGSSGWEWTARPEMAETIRQAIAIHRKETPPALVRLPVAVSLPKP